jgi:hypothetical protein
MHVQNFNPFDEPEVKVESEYYDEVQHSMIEM